MPLGPVGVPIHGDAIGAKDLYYPMSPKGHGYEWLQDEQETALTAPVLSIVALLPRRASRLSGSTTSFF